MIALGPLDVRVALDDAALRRLAELVAEHLAAEADRGTPADDPWLTAEQAAAHIGARSAHRIYELKALGKLKYTKDGTRLLFKRSWLDEYLRLQEGRL
jgi:excisionase family DNA binding protein